MVDWDTIEPKWMQGVGAVLPPDIIEVFVSGFDDLGFNGAEGRLVAVGSAGFYVALVKARVTSNEKWVATVDLEAFPLSVIESVQTRFDTVEDGESPQPEAVSIHLNRTPKDFDKEVSLPISKEDYKGDRKTARAAALRFARALLGNLHPLVRE